MDTKVIVLAAGKGTRMDSEIPKVLIRLNGRPMIQYLLDAIRASGVDPRPVIVVGHNADLLRASIGPGYQYVYQQEQLGTGHAVQRAEALLAGRTKNVMVLYGDHPFVRPETIVGLGVLHEREGRVLSMMTTVAEDFEGWRAPFADFGRVIRNAAGEITAIVEIKDATPEVHPIREVSPAFFCFKAAWLWKNLKKIKNDNAKREYYLTDLVRIAIDEGQAIASININPLESIGINTPSHLELARTFV